MSFLTIALDNYFHALPLVAVLMLLMLPAVARWTSRR
jgi:hypothetical protein